MITSTKIPHIIFEDDTILVLNKPSGITVNKSDTTANEMTVQDWVEKRQLSLQRATEERGGNPSEIASPVSELVRNEVE